MDLFAHPHPATLQMPPHSRLGARPCAGTDPAQCSPTRRRELAEDLGDFVWAELPPLQRRFEQRGRLPGRQTVRGMDERDAKRHDRFVIRPGANYRAMPCHGRLTGLRFTAKPHLMDLRRRGDPQPVHLRGGDAGGTMPSRQRARHFRWRARARVPALPQGDQVTASNLPGSAAIAGAFRPQILGTPDVEPPAKHRSCGHVSSVDRRRRRRQTGRPAVYGTGVGRTGVVGQATGIGLRGAGRLGGAGRGGRAEAGRPGRGGVAGAGRAEASHGGTGRGGPRRGIEGHSGTGPGGAGSEGAGRKCTPDVRSDA